MNQISLERVTYLPKQLAPGVLYVSTEYSVAGHLCACGCGSKVITPLGTAEWSFSERQGQPTLRPSVGNWQLPCRSHYLISGGRIVWAGQLSDAVIAEGRQDEKRRREMHYRALDEKRGFWSKLWRKVREMLMGH